MKQTHECFIYSFENDVHYENVTPSELCPRNTCSNFSFIMCVYNSVLNSSKSQILLRDSIYTHIGTREVLSLCRYSRVCLLKEILYLENPNYFNVETFTTLIRPYTKYFRMFFPHNYIFRTNKPTDVIKQTIRHAVLALLPINFNACNLWTVFVRTCKRNWMQAFRAWNRLG